MRSTLLKLRKVLAGMCVVIFVATAVLVITGVRFNIGKFRLPGARDVGMVFSRTRIGFRYERPAGLPMMDSNRKLIEARVKEGADTTTLPPPTDVYFFGFHYRNMLMGIELPTMADGPGPHDARPLTERELAELVSPRELTTRRQMFLWMVPTWFVLLLSGTIAAGYFAGPYRRQRTLLHRQRHNLCRACGYDLRGTPDRCSECGVAASGANIQVD